MRTRTTNNRFRNLSRLGTINTNNKFTVITAGSNDLGVAVSQSGTKKATTLEILFPAERSEVGSRTAGRLVLNGRQARALYETLHAAYESGNVNNG